MSTAQPTYLVIGGSSPIIPFIKEAQRLGYRVIACDRNPDAPCRDVADLFLPVDGTDLDGALEIARSNNVSAVSTYAADPLAPTAAYVSEKLKLPGNPYESVRLLTRKNEFRSYMKSRGCRVPDFQSHTSSREAFEATATFRFPALLKPVDSSGSKGVTMMDTPPESFEEFEAIWQNAMRYSNQKEAILEEKIERKGYQIAGDGFLFDGELVFSYFANEHFTGHPNPLVPVGESFPAIHPEHLQKRLHDVYADLLSGLGMQVGGLNFDAIITEDDDIFIIELGPRAGGNMIPEVTKLSCGADLLSSGVRAAAGLPVELESPSGPPLGYFSSYMIHSKHSGVLREVRIDPEIERKIVLRRDYAKPGMKVEPYTGANHTVGGLILEFDNMDEMLDRMDNMDRYIEARAI